MGITISSLSKLSIAYVALIRTIPSMNFQVVPHITNLHKRLFTVQTLENLIVASTLGVHFPDLFVALFLLFETLVIAGSNFFVLKDPIFVRLGIAAFIADCLIWWGFWRVYLSRAWLDVFSSKTCTIRGGAILHFEFRNGLRMQQPLLLLVDPHVLEFLSLKFSYRSVKLWLFTNSGVVY